LDTALATASPSGANPSPKAAGAGGLGAADTLTVSSTARALDTALATAKKALDGMPDKELRELVKRTQRDVSLNESLAVPGVLGKEVPDSTDEARLDMSRRATGFVRHLVSPSWSPGKDRLNPFHGMSRSDLAAIKYDETGQFTLDERRAAAHEAARQRSEWAAYICGRAASERTRFGESANVLREVLAYYEALPAVERAELPPGYLENLRLKIAAAVDAKEIPWEDLITRLLSSHRMVGPSRLAAARTAVARP
jgi:hypothetical protein